MGAMKELAMSEAYYCAKCFPEFDPDMIEMAYWDYNANLFDGTTGCVDWITNQFNAIKKRVRTCAEKTGYEYEFLIDMINEVFTDNFSFDDYSFWDLKKDVNCVVESAYYDDF